MRMFHIEILRPYRAGGTARLGGSAQHPRERAEIDNGCFIPARRAITRSGISKRSCSSTGGSPLPWSQWACMTSGMWWVLQLMHTTAGWRARPSGGANPTGSSGWIGCWVITAGQLATVALPAPEISCFGNVQGSHGKSLMISGNPFSGELW